VHVGKGRKEEGANIKGWGGVKWSEKGIEVGATCVGPTFNSGEFSSVFVCVVR